MGEIDCPLWTDEMCGGKPCKLCIHLVVALKARPEVGNHEFMGGHRID